jgi:3-oxoacid CoA-transferase
MDAPVPEPPDEWLRATEDGKRGPQSGKCGVPGPHAASVVAPGARRGSRAAMATRICESAREAVADVRDGDTLLVHSFGPPQAWPTDLLLALHEAGPKDLTVVCNSTARGPTSVQILADKQQVRKLVCTFAVLPVGPTPFSEQIREGRGRARADAAGHDGRARRARAARGSRGFYTPVGVGTVVEEGKEVREFDGRPHLFERAIRATSRADRRAAGRSRRQPHVSARRPELRPAFATAGPHDDRRGARARRARRDRSRGRAPRRHLRRPRRRVDAAWDPSIVRQMVMMAGRTRAMEGRRSATAARSACPPDLMAMRAGGAPAPRRVREPRHRAPDARLELHRGRGITLHSENGILGFGGFPAEGRRGHRPLQRERAARDAGAGTAYFDSTVSFAMARTGRVSSVILGGFQVAPNGDLANWNVPSTGVGGSAAPMDLAAGVAAGGGRVIVVMSHREKSGGRSSCRRSPIRRRHAVREGRRDRPRLPPGDAGRLPLARGRAGLRVDDVRAATAAPLAWRPTSAR